MAKADPHLDALILGEHPSAYLAAALLRQNSKLRVVHSTIPDQPEVDRLVVINPEFFKLHPLLEPLRRKLDVSAIYGLQFLSGDRTTRSEHHSKAALAYVASYKAIRSAMIKIAEAQDVEMLTPKTLVIHRLDEHGAEVTVGRAMLQPKALIIGGNLPEPQQKLLGMPDGWGPDVVHRYTYLKLPGSKWADLGSRPLIPMCLNLKDALCWAWLLAGPKGMQLAVEQPIETVGQFAPQELLKAWVHILRIHEVLSPKCEIPVEDAEYVDLPLAGALAHEGVANRTLLIGPACGFYSACSEDIYPNCWSAIHAADALKKALRERHLQDALQPYRYRWRTTLGDYLRGPQQNLRFLLPMVYRNQKMTMRLTEAILTGKSVVR
ncbi:MAG TPA: hypothetical protein VH370_15585 [Humisphaera sp.]|jgi:hypothetical protein|nr:hypothetical protein [Humisphaera sp.]